MLIQRSSDENDSTALWGALAVRGELSGSLGVAWPLVIQIAGWVIQGIGLGLTVAQSVKQAGQKMEPGETMTREDISLVADQLSQKFPTTSKSAWEDVLSQGLAAKVEQPTGPGGGLPCPAGFLRDPITGACVEIKKAGFEMPTWGWFAVGGGILYLVTQTGMLQRAR